MINELLFIREHFQITMNQDIINYLQDNTSLIELRIYPLDDLCSRSTYTVLGNISLRLIDLLINQEIKEESLIIKNKDNINETIGMCNIAITFTKEKHTSLFSEKTVIPNTSYNQGCDEQE